MHFFNPAPVMKLVEIVHSVLTDADVIADVRALTERLGKTAVSVADRAGFVANRLLFGYLNQAAAMLESGRATREDIDTAMTVGAGLPMGPLTLLDLIGLDTSVQILDTIYAETRDRRYAAAPSLRHLVAAGSPRPQDRPRLVRLHRTRTTASSPRRQPAAGFGKIGVVGHGARAESRSRARIGHHVHARRPGQAQAAGRLRRSSSTPPAEPADEVRSRFAAIGRAAASDAVLVTTAAGSRGTGMRGSGGRVRTASSACTSSSRSSRPTRADERRRAVLGELVPSVVSSADAVSPGRRAGRAHGTDRGAQPRPGRIHRGRVAAAAPQRRLADEAGRATPARRTSTRPCVSAADTGSGPFALLDQLGARAVLDGLNAIYAERPEPGLAPAALLRQVAALDTLT